VIVECNDGRVFKKTPRYDAAPGDRGRRRAAARQPAGPRREAAAVRAVNRRYRLGAPCPRCGVALTEKSTFKHGGAVGCRACREKKHQAWVKRVKRRPAPDVAEPVEQDQEQRPVIETPTWTNWERADCAALPSTADGGLYLGAVVLVVPGRYESVEQARAAADHLLGALRVGGDAE
jgi:uncharacterized Zn finger protein (UPF0148 family)